MLFVDPDELRKLSSSLDSIAATVDGLEVASTTGLIASKLPGAGLDEICSTAGTTVENAYLRVANRLRRISAIAQGGARNYEVTDDDFRRRLDQLNGTS